MHSLGRKEVELPAPPAELYQAWLELHYLHRWGGGSPLGYLTHFDDKSEFRMVVLVALAAERIAGLPMNALSEACFDAVDGRSIHLVMRRFREMAQPADYWELLGTHFRKQPKPPEYVWPTRLRLPSALADSLKDTVSDEWVAAAEIDRVVKHLPAPLVRVALSAAYRMWDQMCAGTVPMYLIDGQALPKPELPL